MKNDKQQGEFEKRWQNAIKAPDTIVARVEKREVDISIETVVARYAMMLDAAVAAHSLEKSVHDEVLTSLAQLKSTVRKVDHKKIKALKLSLPL